jgi:MFS-type transporter involved in bile tolerance (Atg22 family)
MSSLFIGPALLQLSNEAAGCTGGDDDCPNKIYGFKPSSLLSNIAILSGLAASITLPLFGAIVDKTPYRKQVGIISAVMLTVLKGVEVSVSIKTWFFVSLLQVLSGALYYIHTCVVFAYTSELTRDPDQQTKYNSYMFVVLYVSTLLFLGEVLGLAVLFNTNDVGTARISQVITTVTATITFGVAWRYFFRDRPALSEVPPGQSLFSCGFRKIGQTMTRIHNELPALQWLMLSISCSESATATLVTIATTFMSHFLLMDATEIGTDFLLVLIMGIPGSKLGERLGLLYNPVVSAKICVVCFIGTTTAAALLIQGPEQKHFMYMFCVLWGLELGWLHPMHSSIFINIMPKGKEESELMGMYLFCGQILSWLPPLVFTFLNEAGVDMALGLASLNVFFLAGLAFLVAMGSYDQAVAAAVGGDGENVEIVNETGGISLPPLA